MMPMGPVLGRLNLALLALLWLTAALSPQSAAHRKIGDSSGGFTGTLDDHDAFGFSLAALGDLDGDGFDDFAIGSKGAGQPFNQHKGIVHIVHGRIAGEIDLQWQADRVEGALEYDIAGASIAAADVNGDGTFVVKSS